ncbi:MAG: hypothetical protein IKU94_02315 [Bacteroidaceae bacterium]|nr:hypothetical protein [Bacteroidaceae bacterium]
MKQFYNVISCEPPESIFTDIDEFIAVRQG